MKKFFAFLILVAMITSLCACGSEDKVDVTDTAYQHIERHYKADGRLFYISDTNKNSGITFVTYFYWTFDDGRQVMSGVEWITIDSTGKIIAHESGTGS